MNVEDTIAKLRAVTTMPKLDGLRKETVEAMESDDFKSFERVQNEFRKAKNRLLRIPLKNRTW